MIVNEKETKMIYQIGIKFDGNSKVYPYKFDQLLKIGEVVIVEVCGKFNLVKVVSVDEWTGPLPPTKWIVSRINDVEYQERKKEEEREGEITRLHKREDYLQKELENVRMQLFECNYLKTCVIK